MAYKFWLHRTPIIKPGKDGVDIGDMYINNYGIVGSDLSKPIDMFEYISYIHLLYSPLAGMYIITGTIKPEKYIQVKEYENTHEKSYFGGIDLLKDGDIFLGATDYWLCAIHTMHEIGNRLSYTIRNDNYICIYDLLNRKDLQIDDSDMDGFILGKLEEQYRHQPEMISQQMERYNRGDDVYFMTLDVTETAEKVNELGEKDGEK